MDDPLGVDEDQRVHHGQDDPHRVIEADFAAVSFQVVEQALALDEFHRKIGGAVFFKIGVDAADVVVADKLGERLRFGEKALLAVVKELLLFSRKGGDGVTVGAQSDRIGEEFFERDSLARLMILGDIGDAEAALA